MGEGDVDTQRSGGFLQICSVCELKNYSFHKMKKGTGDQFLA